MKTDLYKAEMKNITRTAPVTYISEMKTFNFSKGQDS